MSPYVDIYANLTAGEWAGIATALDATIAMNIASLVVSGVCLFLLLLGAWERRRTLARNARWWAHTDAQLILMLVGMNVLNLIFQTLDLVADYASPRSSPAYCFGVAAVPFIVYGVLYTRPSTSSCSSARR